MIEITPKALEQVRQIASTNDFENFYLRVGVKSGGCSGLQYEFDIEKDGQANENDRIFQKEDIEIRINPKAYLYLNGLKIDYQKDGLNSGFVFDNPSAKRSCGCGTSFTT